MQIEKTLFKIENAKMSELQMKMRQFGSSNLTAANRGLVNDNPSLMLEVVVSPSKPQKEKLETFSQDIVNVRSIIEQINTERNKEINKEINILVDSFEAFS